jgi:hypothetical protein
VAWLVSVVVPLRGGSDGSEARAVMVAVMLREGDEGKVKGRRRMKMLIKSPFNQSEYRPTRLTGWWEIAQRGRE